MDRRQYLKGVSAVSVGLPGCLETGAGAGEPAFEERLVTLASIDRHPTEFGCRISVEMVETEVTPEHTAEVRATMSNAGDREIPLARFPDNVGNIAYHSDSNFGLLGNEADYVLHPNRDWQPERESHCWTPDGSGFNGADMPVVLPPGEELTVEYWLWDVRGTRPCWPTGDYHFGAESWIGERWSGTPQFRWLFTLRVSDPDEG